MESINDARENIGAGASTGSSSSSSTGWWEKVGVGEREGGERYAPSHLFGCEGPGEAWARFEAGGRVGKGSGSLRFILLGNSRSGDADFLVLAGRGSSGGSDADFFILVVGCGDGDTDILAALGSCWVSGRSFFFALSAAGTGLSTRRICGYRTAVSFFSFTQYSK